MRQLLALCVLFTVIALAPARGAAPQHPTMPAGMTHEEHLKQMEKDAALKKRGAEAMGFDQDATTHHFLLARDGGAIEVGVNDDRAATVRAAIRSHLTEISSEFAGGVFDKPFATHAEVPPGVATMRRLRTSIAYAYGDTPRGGRVRIRTTNAEALGAVHDFLRYQIKEHGTGDPLTVRQ